MLTDSFHGVSSPDYARQQEVHACVSFMAQGEGKTAMSFTPIIG